MTPAFQTALILRASGFSVIPVKADKRPLIPWKEFQTRTPEETELQKWFARNGGIALCAGRVMCLDFDEKYSAGIFPRFVKRAEEVGLDYVVGDLMRQRTPSGGYHLVWQCEGLRLENQKLASRPATPEEKAKDPNVREFSMIETRGEGGYFLIAPSAGYTLEQGDWSSIPLISEDDRDALLSLARSFDERPPVEAVKEDTSPLGADISPCDDYDFRADIPALLRQHGWKAAGRSGKYWTRPGKDKGISASWDVVPGRLWVFSTSTAFNPNHVYKPYAVYAVLECAGDFARASSELRRQGFGGALPKKRQQPSIAEQLDKIGEPPGIEPTPSDPPAVEGADPHGQAPTTETEDDRIRRLLRARSFDPMKVPPPLRPILSLGGVVICTPGNLTAITAQAKVGKSALVSALTAASMTAPDADADCLTAVGYNVGGKALVYIDTEQAPDDFWHAVNRARRRARTDTMPDWLRAFTIADLPAQVGRKAVAIAMADAAEAHGGIHAVIIDGVADIVLDVNDAEECNGIVAELHGQAIRYDCAIICVIHKNPGSDKTRGHLGSQIERKAETNLTLEKDDEVTVVWSSKQRRAPIDRKTGPRFRWDEDLKMHVTANADSLAPSARVLEMLDLAQSVLKEGESLRWAQLINALTEARRTPNSTPAQRTVERWVTAMQKAQILTVFQGNYSLSKAATVTDTIPANVGSAA
jgi:hypothetical protein